MINSYSKLSLGNGSFGQVDAVDGKAVKSIESDPTSEAKFLQHCHKQAPFAFLKMYSYDVCKQTITMELALMDLATLCKKEVNLDEQTMRSIVKQLVNALRHLREAGVVHADLKPENILVFEDNDCNGELIVKVGDFGQALNPNMPYDEDQIRVTSWFAPFDKVYTYETDMWSMGLVVQIVVHKYIHNTYSPLFAKKDDLRDWSEDTSRNVMETVHYAIVDLLGLVPQDRIPLNLNKPVNVRVFLDTYQDATQTQEAISEDANWDKHLWDLMYLINGLIKHDPRKRKIAFTFVVSCNDENVHNNKKRPIDPAMKEHKPSGKKPRVSQSPVPPSVPPLTALEEQQSPLNVQGAPAKMTLALSTQPSKFTKHPEEFCVVS